MLSWYKNGNALKMWKWTCKNKTWIAEFKLETRVCMSSFRIILLLFLFVQCTTLHFQHILFCPSTWMHEWNYILLIFVWMVQDVQCTTETNKAMNTKMHSWISSCIRKKKKKTSAEKQFQNHFIWWLCARTIWIWNGN